MKVPIFDKRVRNTFGTVLAWILSVFSVGIVFFPIMDDKTKWIVLSFLLVVLLCLYIIVWIFYNKTKSVKI